MALDKNATRATLKAAGPPTPRNMLIQGESGLLKAAKHVGFPSILKPVSGAESLGVKKATNMGQMVAC
jgi:biotin carboxylase